MAGCTGFIPGILDFYLGAKYGILKGNLDIIPEISPLMNPRRRLGRSPSAPAEKGVENTGKIPENIFEIPEGRGEILLASAHAFHSGEPELIIGSPFLVVGEDLIGLGGLLEFFLSLFIARILIRVILDGEFSVGLLYIILRCTLLKT
jgi:hypothetical protein